LTDREHVATDLIGIVGLAGLAAGLVVLRTSDQIGFDPGAAWSGVASQLAVTLPAALLVLGATGLELGAGLVLARLLRRQPFDSLAEAAIAALVATTLKGALLIGLLGAFGLYRGAVLIAVDVAIVVWGRWVPIGPRVGRLLAAGWLDRATYRGSIPLAILVAVVWAGPVLLQLSSPVVPFIDVLPNYVGPAEHLRTFGFLSPLTETQSPIIGPSRSVLGYDALLGGVSTITNLPAVLAVAGYILPSTLLVAAGIQRLATAMVGDDVPIGPWALLAFALTESFARLGDARGTVIVLPLVCFALAIAVERSRRSTEPRGAGGNLPDAWRPGAGFAMGLALAAAVLVHPVVGAFAIATVAVLALYRHEQLAADAAVAGVTAVVIAIPQLGVMLGKPIPTLALAVALLVGPVLGAWFARRVARDERLRGALAWLALWARPALVLMLAIALAIAVAAGLLLPDEIPAGLGAGVQLVLDGCGVLLVALALGWLVGSAGARSALIAATAVVGVLAVVLTQLLPGDLGFFGDALRFEVPKTVHYWLPVFVSIGAGAGLAKAVALGRAGLPRWLAAIPAATAGPLAAIAVAVIVAFAAFPARTEAIDAYHLGEHQLSEALAIDLHYAGSGFWIGFPDSRTIVDEPRREIVDAIRREIDSGRLAHDTPVLHVAKSFQEWVSTPLGVFDGVTETFASPDQEVSHQTAGGRLFNMGDLAGLIDGGTFQYAVLEPNGLPDAAAVQAALVAKGYVSIFQNGQGMVYRLGG
jgi:hypothetical protein